MVRTPQSYPDAPRSFVVVDGKDLGTTNREGALGHHSRDTGGADRVRRLDHVVEKLNRGERPERHPDLGVPSSSLSPSLR